MLNVENHNNISEDPDVVAVLIVTESKLTFSQVKKRSKHQTFEPPEIKSNPLLAINEMCNYITACSCHLEN